MFLTILTFAVVRAGNTIYDRVDNLVGSDMCKVPGDISELPNIIFVKNYLSVFPDDVAK